MSVEEVQSWRRCRNRRREKETIPTFCSISKEHDKLTSSHLPMKVRIKERSRSRFIPWLIVLAAVKVHMICAFRPSVYVDSCGTRNKIHNLPSQYITSPIVHTNAAADRCHPTNLRVQATSWMTIDSSLGSVERKRTSPTNKNGTITKTKGKSSNKRGGKRRKYNRKMPLSPSEKALLLSRRKRNATYEKMRLTSLKKNQAPPSIWSFDSLFPDPVFDEKSVREDLFG